MQITTTATAKLRLKIERILKAVENKEFVVNQYEKSTLDDLHHKYGNRVLGTVNQKMFVDDLYNRLPKSAIKIDDRPDQEPVRGLK